MKTRIKMCGLTRKEDIKAACDAGADALGFVFYPPSPRNVSVEVAKTLMASVPAFVTTVALFVDADVSFVEQVISETNVDLLQFHGDESPEYCTQFTRPYIKAIRAQSKPMLEENIKKHPQAKAILLDSYVQGIPGGTGKTFDWSMIPECDGQPLVLAGGLNETNVANAVSKVSPWAVDVSGGIEADKGIKSNAKMQQFAQQVLNSKRGQHD
jgi:phosphoribosylanthranilate isomerase